MIDGQKALIDACEKCNVPSYVASDWALDYSKLNLGELFPKDPMIHVKAYLAIKKVQGVHILIGGFMEPVFSPFFNIFDPSTSKFRYWGNGDEVMEGTTYDNADEFTAAVALDPEATEIVRCQAYESPGSLDDLYKTMHELRQKNPADVLSDISMFFYYYWINGQTLVGTELDNSKYPEVKPVDWEAFMPQGPL
ncbi:hypothetical protein PoHVEF18_007344 [Penicillium ochrochloron]